MNTVLTKNGTELTLIDLKGKAYLPVQQRIIWFREERPLWGIEVELISVSDTSAVAKATIRNEEGRIIAQDHKSETIKGFADFIEKSCTGAIGRAVAQCGFGTQFAVELDEGEERIADAPVERRQQQKSETQSDVVTFGKFKNTKYTDLKKDDVQSYVNYLKDSAAKDNKPLSAQAEDFIVMARAAFVSMK